MAAIRRGVFSTAEAMARRDIQPARTKKMPGYFYPGKSAEDSYAKEAFARYSDQNLKPAVRP